MPNFRVTASQLQWQTFAVEAADRDDAERIVMEATEVFGDQPTLTPINSGEGDFQINDIQRED